MDKGQVPRVGVSCIIIKDNKILVGQRKGEHGGGSWAPPGGKLDFNEEPSKASAR